MSTAKLNTVVAACTNRGIGINGQLPWRIRGDMEFFKRITSETTDSSKQNVVIMGRKTWESIPPKFKPLKKRINIIISTTLREVPEGVHIATSFDEAVDLATSEGLSEKVEGIFVIGGHSVYKAAHIHPLCHRIYLTRVLQEFECDTYLPEIDSTFQPTELSHIDGEVREEDGIPYKFEVYEKVSQ